MDDELLSYGEFISLATQNKISLIDQLAAKMLHVGYEAASASAEYYRVKLTAKDHPRLPELAAQRENDR